MLINICNRTKVQKCNKIYIKKLFHSLKILHDYFYVVGVSILQPFFEDLLIWIASTWFSYQISIHYIEVKRRHYTVIRIKYQFFSVLVITFLLKKTKYIKKFKRNIHYLYQVVNNTNKRLSSIKKILFL